MGRMITYHGYNDGYNNPVYNMHKTVGVRYTWEHMIHGKILYFLSILLYPTSWDPWLKIVAISSGKLKPKRTHWEDIRWLWIC